MSHTQSSTSQKYPRNDPNCSLNHDHHFSALMLLVLTSDFRSDARCIFEVFLWYVILNLHCLRVRSSRFFYSGYLPTSFIYYLHLSSSSISSFSSLRKVLYDRPSGRLALVFELMDANLYELIKGTIYEQLNIIDKQHPQYGSMDCFLHNREVD